MTKLTRTEFIASLADGVDLARLDPSLRTTATKLDDGDGVLRGRELDGAWSLTDRLDTDGDRGTITSPAAERAARAFLAARVPSRGELAAQVASWKGDTKFDLSQHRAEFTSAARRFLHFAEDSANPGSLFDLGGNLTWAASTSIRLNLAAVAIPAAIRAGAGWSGFDAGAAEHELDTRVGAEVEQRGADIDRTARELESRIGAATPAELPALAREIQTLRRPGFAKQDLIYRDLLLDHARATGSSLYGSFETKIASGQWYGSHDLPLGALSANGRDIAAELNALGAPPAEACINTNPNTFLVREEWTPSVCLAQRLRA